jgi:hypothetical protein
MERWPAWLKIVNVFLMAAVVWIAVGYLPRLKGPEPRKAAAPQKLPPEFEWIDPARGLKINMFYASPGVVDEGQTTSMCYSVSNAVAVRLEPPAAELRPSLNRCIELKPARDTTYTLEAEGADGKKVTETLKVYIRPVPELGPQISYFRVSKTVVEGQTTFHTLCFHAWNAQLVEVEPQAFPPWKLLQGCFPAVVKDQPVIYTLTVKGTMGRKAVKKLVLQPGPRRQG